MATKKSQAAAPKAASKAKKPAAPKATTRTVTAAPGGVVVRLRAWPTKSTERGA